jgi:AcrR family transcriptional regulator
MAKGEALRNLTAATIIDRAAAVLAERGAASMDEIASSAGIGRATLYRYFSTREALLKAMAAASVQELRARITEAGLGAVSFEEAIARLTRGMIATGSKYTVLGGESARYADSDPAFDVEVIEPIRALFRRGIAEGAVRADLPPDLLLDLFSGLIKGALDATASGRRGVEEAAAAVTTLFLRGVGL